MGSRSQSRKRGLAFRVDGDEVSGTNELRTFRASPYGDYLVPGGQVGLSFALAESPAELCSRRTQRRAHRRNGAMVSPPTRPIPPPGGRAEEDAVELIERATRERDDEDVKLTSALSLLMNRALSLITWRPGDPPSAVEPTSAALKVPKRGRRWRKVIWAGNCCVEDVRPTGTCRQPKSVRSVALSDKGT